MGRDDFSPDRDPVVRAALALDKHGQAAVLVAMFGGSKDAPVQTAFYELRPERKSERPKRTFWFDQWQTNRRELEHKRLPVMAGWTQETLPLIVNACALPETLNRRDSPFVPSRRLNGAAGCANTPRCTS